MLNRVYCLSIGHFFISHNAYTFLFLLNFPQSQHSEQSFILVVGQPLFEAHIPAEPIYQSKFIQATQGFDFNHFFSSIISFINRIIFFISPHLPFSIGWSSSKPKVSYNSFLHCLMASSTISRTRTPRLLNHFFLKSAFAFK